MRLASIDAYRGFVMLLMMAELLHLPEVARQFPESAFWGWVGHHTSHVAWTGCSLHDLIQPSFSFLVGVALPFSLASRLAKGHSRGRLLAHALWRALLLVLLGVFLRSVGHPQTRWTFEDTLSQIGLGYPLLFLLALAAVRWQLFALLVILVGYWFLFALAPVPAEFDYAAVGVKDTSILMSGFEAHWNMNSNPAWRFDGWFLNLFPRIGDKPFVFNGGGYSTLSFIPTLGTMILGLIAGGWLKALPVSARTAGRLLLTGLVLLGVGYGLHHAGVGPSVKKIWTPTWVLFSGGWCFALLAAFYAACELGKLSRPQYPLMVVGRNSIAVYVLVHVADGFVVDALTRHVPAGVWTVFGETFRPAVLGSAALLTFWLMLWWMDRNRVYVKL